MARTKSSSITTELAPVAPLDRFTGGDFGKGVGANLMELYRFLVYN